MTEVENLEKLRGHFVSARRKEVAKVLRSKSPSVEIGQPSPLNS
jgi:hypothetical protein